MERVDGHGRLDGVMEQDAADLQSATPNEQEHLASAQQQLHGQAQAAVEVAAPKAGETITIVSEPGAVYALDVLAEDARFQVDGEDIVLIFDADGDGTADSRIVFLKLAGMAEEADAPLLQVAGVDYDVSALLEVAFALPEGAEPGSLPQTPAGPPAETAGGEGSPAAKGGGATQYQDNLGETVVSEAIDALAGVGAPTAATGVSSGSVFTGLPLLVSDAPEIFVASSPVSGDSGPTVETVAGQVVDGYIANATVFRDANGNGELDEGEVFGTTDINGNFSLTGGSGPLIAIGGTDVSTGLAFEGVLKAPEGATVITPLTTLVQQLVEGGTDAGAAETQVKQALGIDEGFDLNNTDPVAAAAGGDTEALEVVKAGIQVANTAVQVTAALEGAGATDAEAASDAAFQAIADKIAQEGTGTDLSDDGQVGDVLGDAAQTHQDNTGETTADDLSPDDIANATSVITTTNEVVEDIDIDENSDAVEVLTDLAEVAQVAQDDASEAIEQAVENDDGSAVENFDDTSEIEVAAENAEVGDVDGADVLDDGDNVTVGGDGGDSFDGLGGNDSISGGGGTDAISGGAGNDTLDGGDGADVLQGGAGDDSILGGAGNDDIIGNAGSDTIDGGADIDVARYDADVRGFTFAGGDGGEILVTETATGDTDTITNVESLTFGDTAVLLVGTGHPFASIQDAIDAADEGDVILVADGSYGPITIDKSLTLLAIGDGVTITGAGVNQGSAVRIESGVDDVVLGGPGNGFDIETGNGDLAAVYVVGDNEDVVIEGNSMLGIAGHALLTGGQIDGLTVRGNDLSGEGPAAVAYNNGEASLGAANASSDVRFIDNTISGGDNAGLLLGIEAGDAVITGNTFNGETADFGLLEIFGENAVITGNDFNGGGFVPAIRDSFDNYDDDGLIVGNSFEGVAVPVLSPDAAITIDADQLGDEVTALDISSLSGVAATFTSLGNLIEITTSNGQSVQLDGGQIAAAFPDASPLATDQSLTIAGDAAVAIVNAGLTLPNDGTAPSVSNLLALEFDGLDAEQSRIPESLTVDGSHANAFAAFWIFLDQSYVSGGSFLNLPVNTDFAYLGNDYVRYLNAGGEALLDLVKVSDDRQQTLHDNLLGNLGDGPIADRFTNLAPENQPDPRTEAAKEFGDRPYHAGNVTEVNGELVYSDFLAASGTVGWDLAHGIDYPDGLPAPYDVLDGDNVLTGASQDYFFGGGGNDTITGDDGEDTASYFGERLDFDISGDSEGGVTVTDGNANDGDEGSDSLSDIETLQFADGTMRFEAALQRGVPETTAGGGDENSDNFHPGTGNSNENFVVHDNTEAQIEVAIKAKVRFQGDPDSEGLTYFVETGVTPGSSTGLWNFDYSIVDYGAADISGDTYSISIVADFTDVHGNTTQGVMVFDPIVHRTETGEDYYQDASGATDGLQNSQNIGWYFNDYDPSAPGSYDFVLTVRDAESGEVVGQSEMRVEVSANFEVIEGESIQAAIDAASDGDTILVGPGTYDENLTIDKQITLIGAQSGIDPTGGGGRGGAETVINGNIAVTVGADNATIDGFTLNKGAGNVGISLEAGATDITIQNNILNGGAVDDFSAGTRGIINADNGGNTGLTVSQNSFSGWRTGLYVEEGAPGAVISGNDFDGNLVGLAFEEPDGQVVTGNSFTNNQQEGIGLGAKDGSREVVLDGNTFAGNGGQPVGVYSDGDGITVTSNDAGTGGVLVLQDGATDVELLGEGGLSVTGNSGDNEITGNNGANALDGAGGADTLAGGFGDDSLVGGEGNDVLYGNGDDTSATFSTDFSEFDTGPITDGENDWILRGNADRDQEIVDLGGDRGNVFRISSDPSITDFAGPYSPVVKNSSGEAETVGEPLTSADFDTIRVTYDFRPVSDMPDSSRVEVDFGRVGSADRINFMVLEWDASVGLRIAANEPTTTNDQWYTNDYTAFSGNRTVVEGLDVDGAQWHQLEMVLRFNDGADNDVIEIYLDGQLIGTSTTFENYWNWLDDDHDANAETNQAVGLFFRPSGSGAAADGDGGDNQGFYFDNLEITATSSATDHDDLSGGAGDDTMVGGAGDDTIDGGADFDTAVFSGNRDQYEVSIADTTITVTGPDGTDSLTGIEEVRFDDQSIFVVTDGQSIQAAIDAASDGDTIIVRPGTYAETLDIDKQVTLLGVQSGVDPNGDSRSGAETTITGGILLRDGADGTTIDGFTLQEGNGNLQGQKAGIYLASGAADITIQNNILTHTNNDALTDGFRGILGTSNGGNTGLTISQNSFTGWSSGVFINPGATDALVSNNTFDGNFVGMSIDGPDGAVVTNNSFTNNPYEGLGLGPGEANPTVTLDGNSFSGNGTLDGDRSIGVYDDIEVTSNDPNTDAALELMDGYATGIVLSGTAPLSVIGNDAANDIEGNDGANLLDGEDAGDTIDGGGGDDTVIGGLGDDDLAGDDGADILYGGEGNDTLYGDAGSDTLFGGADNDTFAYETLLDAGDLIDGFDAEGADSIDLDALFDALGVDTADRGARVQVLQDGTGADATILIDSDPSTAGFEVTLATVVNVTGDLTVDDLVLSVP
ncbi:right-handed parallel beta-helix repeat-containing protein [Pelagibius sp.]|uniref:right-handed parallel beta-helix repeat-containing protein n=1 Tax=Pelagibius sp. TaxID=1931238 RepID=UPI002628CBE6|nr:right-handed parallel beta-helix repeat-containing protein [Pelagibius sp.]